MLQIQLITTKIEPHDRSPRDTIALSLDKSQPSGFEPHEEGEFTMGQKLESDPLFYVLTGVARDRRDEIGDTADLMVDPVWLAAVWFLGIENSPGAPVGHLRGPNLLGATGSSLARDFFE